MIPTPASIAPGSGKPESAAAWQLIRDDVFDRLLDDEELARLVTDRAKTSAEPHADLIRLMLGMSLGEAEACALFDEVVEHRRELARALGRDVHVRVAALDLLTARTVPTSRQSRPIMVAPDFFERALEEAGADAVTGLPRSQHLLNLLQYELLQRRRRLAVAFVDLDGFKLVNDEHGHARGDQVLRLLADAARTVLRRGDVVARVGGDEFVLMLVDLTADEARAAVERVRSHFEELTRPLATSFSVGLAFAEADLSAEELVSRADRAMYAEKRKRAAAKAKRVGAAERQATAR